MVEFSSSGDNLPRCRTSPPSRFTIRLRIRGRLVQPWRLVGDCQRPLCSMTVECSWRVVMPARHSTLPRRFTIRPRIPGQTRAIWSRSAHGLTQHASLMGVFSWLGESTGIPRRPMFWRAPRFTILRRIRGHPGAICLHLGILVDSRVWPPERSSLQEVLVMLEMGSLNRIFSIQRRIHGKRRLRCRFQWVRKRGFHWARRISCPRRDMGLAQRLRLQRATIRSMRLGQSGEMSLLGAIWRQSRRSPMEMLWSSVGRRMGLRRRMRSTVMNPYT